MRGAARIANSQQVSDASNDRIDDGAHGVDRSPPRPGVLGVGLLDDHDLLLDAVGAEHHVLLEVGLRQVLVHGQLAVDDDKAAVELLVQPPGLLDGLEGEQAAENGGEADEEDAGGGVPGEAVGRPGHGEQRGVEVVLEGDHHGHHGVGGAVRHRHAGAGAHIHPCHGIHVVSVSGEDHLG